MKCLFCDLSEERVLFKEGSMKAISDAFPISKGHTLIIPNRHVRSFFDINDTERDDFFIALSRAKKLLAEKFNPDSFNIGINDGAHAGQTVPHLHVHLIPRYLGDQPDPRGGIRWIFPEKANYWS